MRWRRSYGLPLKDRDGRSWDFVVKSWANGTEHRRVYVLEHVMEYICCKRLREGDAIGICADAQGALMIEVPNACFVSSEQYSGTCLLHAG